MVTFYYTIKDEIGIHARPAGLLVKKAKELGNIIKISCNGKTAEATKLMAVMSLGATCGTELMITVEGENEGAAAREMEAFFQENL